MRIDQFEKDVDVIQKLTDYPNDTDGLSPDELKAKFDEAAGYIKEYLNEKVVPALNNTFSAEEVLEEIARGGSGDVNLHGRPLFAGEINVKPDKASGFYIASGLENGDDNKPVALFCGTYDEGLDVILRNIADGITPGDAVNKAQVERFLETLSPMIVTIDNNQGFLAANSTSAEIYESLLSKRKVFLQTKDGYFPCVLADDSGAFFAQVNYEDGKVLAYYIYEDGTAEAIEKAIAFRDEIPRIKDDVVSPDKIWSSKNTVDRLCPTVTKTGTVVQFSTFYDMPLSVSGDFAGTLYVTVCGKNLYDSRTYPFDTVGYVRWESGNINAPSGGSSYRCTSKFIPVAHLKNKNITIKNAPAETATGGATSAGLAFYDADKGFISGTKQGRNITVPSTAVYMRFSISADYVNEAQIELGDSVTDYEPYVSQVYPVDSVGEMPIVVSANDGLNTIWAYDIDSVPLDSTEISVTGKVNPAAMILSMQKTIDSLAGVKTLEV